VPRLGIPALHETDASLGVTNPFGLRVNDTATALSAGPALGASFNPELARSAGAMVGPARAKGFNVLWASARRLGQERRAGARDSKNAHRRSIGRLSGSGRCCRWAVVLSRALSASKRVPRKLSRPVLLYELLFASVSRTFEPFAEAVSIEVSKTRAALCLFDEFVDAQCLHHGVSVPKSDCGQSLLVSDK